MIVYAFKYASCAYEGVDLMTLHATKRGAWEAMRRHMWDEAVQHREMEIRVGWTGKATGAWWVVPMEVLP